ESTGHVRNVRAHGHGWAVFPARGADDARHGLDEQILPWPVRAWPRLAIPSQGAVHQARVERMHALGIEPQTDHHPRATVVHQDVTALHQAVRYLLGCWLTQVQNEAPLVPVARQK